MSRLVFLAAGHGGGDPGAVALGRTEAEDAIRITDAAAHLLTLAGFRITVVPHNLNLADEIRWTNERYEEDSLAVEIHRNAGGGSGIEVFHVAGSTERAGQAALVSKTMAEVCMLPNRGAKPDTATRFGRLGWCRQTRMAALLVEAGFIDTAKDNAVAISYYAKGLADGIAALGGAVPHVVPPEQERPPRLVDHTMPVLRRGNRGEYVALAQKRLRIHHVNVVVDGVFGPATEKGVKAFQKARGITVDGAIGPQTWPLLLQPAGG